MPGKPKPRAPRKPRVSLAQKIKDIALSEAETKLKVWQVLNNNVTVGSGLAKADATVTPAILTKGVYLNNVFADQTIGGTLVPFMSQGTTQQTRIGNSIRDCKLNIKGFVCSNPSSDSTNSSPFPFEVHLLVYKIHNDPLNNPNELLNDTNNTNTYITGSAVNSLFPFNRKGCTIKKHKIFRMRPNFSVGTTSGSTDNVVGVINPDNASGEAQFYRRFNLNISMKDKLLFDDVATSPNNEWIAFGCYVINGDGVILQQTQQRVTVSAFATLRYKDM